LHVGQLYEPALEEATRGGVVGARQRRRIGLCRLAIAAESPEEVGPDRVKQVMALERQAVEQRERPAARALVVSFTRKARAISPVCNPPSRRRASATCAPLASAGMAAGEDQAQTVVFHRSFAPRRFVKRSSTPWRGGPRSLNRCQFRVTEPVQSHNPGRKATNCELEHLWHVEARKSARAGVVCELEQVAGP
jgi:hypothetical protein